MKRALNIKGAKPKGPNNGFPYPFMKDYKPEHSEAIEEAIFRNHRSPTEMQAKYLKIIKESKPYLPYLDLILEDIHKPSTWHPRSIAFFRPKMTTEEGKEGARDGNTTSILRDARLAHDFLGRNILSANSVSKIRALEDASTKSTDCIFGLAEQGICLTVELRCPFLFLWSSRGYCFGGMKSSDCWLFPFGS